MEYLKELCNYLPEPKKMLFLSSEERIKIEYIISKLRHKPGLLAETSAIQNIIQFPFQKEMSAEKPTKNEIENVLIYMKNLTQDIQDKDLASALNLKIHNILKECDSTKYVM